jgi:hypothetical protein
MEEWVSIWNEEISSGKQKRCLDWHQIMWMCSTWFLSVSNDLLGDRTSIIDFLNCCEALGEFAETIVCSSKLDILGEKLV